MQTTLEESVCPSTGDALACYNRGARLLNESRPVEAIAAFREALRLKGDHADAWHGLGCAHRTQGQHREALSAFEQAVRFDPGLAQAWYRLGTLHERDEEYAEALRCYRQAVRARRDYAVAWYSLAVLCREEGQLPEAMNAFLEAIQLKPHDVDAWLGLGMTYAKQRNRGGVLDVYEELAVLDAEAAETFAAQYVNNWTNEPAAPPLPPPAPLRRASGKSGSHPLAATWYEIGVQHRKEGRTAEAVSDFLEAVRFDADHAKAWFSLAELYRAQSSLEEALHALREVLRLKPRLTIAWYQLATIHAQRGQPAKALKAFQRLLQLKPDDVEGWFGLGRACIAARHEAGLVEVTERLRILNPALADTLARERAAAPPPVEDTAATPAHASAVARAPKADVAHGGWPTASSFDLWLSSLRHRAVPDAPSH